MSIFLPSGFICSQSLSTPSHTQVKQPLGASCRKKVIMFDNEKEAVLKVINSLWAHDAWNWGNTCAKLVNQEIDWDKPAIVEIDGEYITANVFVKDGREFQIGYQEGGWWMCFIKDCDDQRARLTKRVPDGLTPGQSEQVRQMIQNALDTGSA